MILGSHHFIIFSIYFAFHCAQARRAVAVQAAARPLWQPGSTPPAHLDGSLPGDFGFDPLNLGSNKASLDW